MTAAQEEKPEQPAPREQVPTMNWRLYIIICGVMIVIFNIVAALVVKFYVFT